MGNLAKVAVALMAWPIGVAIWTWCVWCYWSWFAVPLGAAEPTAAAALCAAMLWRAWPAPAALATLDPSRKATFADTLGRAVAGWIVAAVMVAAGWAVQAVAL